MSARIRPILATLAALSIAAASVVVSPVDSPAGLPVGAALLLGLGAVLAATVGSRGLRR